MVALSLLSLAPTGAAAVDGFVALDVGGSFYSPSLAFGLEGGVRWGRWGLIAKVEVNPWFSLQEKRSLKPGALNVGIGAEVSYFDGRVRTAVLAGTSTLLFGTALDKKGKTGLSVDIIAVTLRWPVHPNVVLRLDPCTLHVVMPVIDRIPLLLLEYRHTFSVEVPF